MPYVVYDNSWDFPEVEHPGPVIMTVATGKLIMKRIPLVVFGEGAWVNLQNSALLSALALRGKQLWQPAKLSVG